MAHVRVLVTGGAGFIGSRLARRLKDEGCLVAVVDNLSSGSAGNVPGGVELKECDLLAAGLRKVFEEVRPEVVFHLAAQMDVRKSVADPAFDCRVNIEGSLRLLELCREFGTERVVFSSTGGAIYGEQDTFPAAEEHPQSPLSPYGVAKLAVEKYLHYYSEVHGLKTTALRYSNVYGPGQNPHGEAGVIAIFSNQLIRGDTPTIYGDGEQTRDYVYVDDVVAANLAAFRDSLSGCYNVGTGVETTVNGVLGTLCAAAGSLFSPIHAAGRAGEQQRSCLDSGRLQRSTAWRPTVSLLDGLTRTFASFQEAAGTVPG